MHMTHALVHYVFDCIRLFICMFTLLNSPWTILRISLEEDPLLAWHSELFLQRTGLHLQVGPSN
ncbi:hypothetical protein BDR06DRAFT_151750 [Suillus hirtellus]|nr:hypothetical protein BDR06DRAFT_151750 [Suillus hirtellus]